MNGWKIFYGLTLLLAEIGSIILSIKAFRVIKDAKVDGKITSDESKDMILSISLSVVIGIAIILSVLYFTGIIK